jgi:large subunit ribosomal protein L3
MFNSLRRVLMQGLLGQKLGMTAIFGENGGQIPVTALYVGGNVVVGKRTQERDGYTALIVGFGEQKVHRINKPELGFLKKQGVVSDDSKTTVRHLREFRMSEADLENYTQGQTVTPTDLFNVGDRIDASGTSKGRGFSGVMKRHNFAGTKATHGVHEFFRHGGSIGCATYPARVFKNKKMPGQYGNARTTVQNLLVAGVIADEDIVLIRGSVPGPNGGVLEIKHGVKVRRL